MNKYILILDTISDILESNNMEDKFLDNKDIEFVTDMVALYDSIVAISRHIYFFKEPFTSNKILVKDYLLEK